MFFIQSSGLYLLLADLLGYKASEILVSVMMLLSLLPWILALLRLKCNIKLVNKLWKMAALATFVYVVLQVLGLLVSSWLLAGFADEAAQSIGLLMAALSFMFIRPEQIARRRRKRRSHRQTPC